MDHELVVVGGGIHGVGVAQAAAARGHSVLLVERDQLAAGTSSRSSKLIHGGLRYLEHGQFALVRQCLREREILLRIAPQLVRLVPFHLPIYGETQRRSLTVRTGLALYGVLTGWHRSARFASLGRRHWPGLDGLRTTGLRRVFRYYDGQTDDRKLTAAVMASARELGAEQMLATEFMAARPEESGWCLDLRQGDSHRQVRCRVLVNAAGPWANEVLARIEGGHTPHAMEWVAGSHIVVPGELSRGAYYLEAPSDGRAVFALPWQGRTMVGTTERVLTSRPEEVTASEEEIDYLLRTLAHYFPGHSQEVVERFAGVRVLPKGEDDAFGRPRDTWLVRDDERAPRLLTLYGGKLTAYRATAQKVMAALAPSLAPASRMLDTAQLPLKPPV